MNPATLTILLLLAIYAIQGFSRGWKHQTPFLLISLIAIFGAIILDSTSFHLFDGVLGELPKVHAATTLGVALLFVTVIARILLVIIIHSKKINLNPQHVVDRILGIAVGIARGLIITIVLIVAAKLTELPEFNFWKTSGAISSLEKPANNLISLLSPEIQRQFSTQQPSGNR